MRRNRWLASVGLRNRLEAGRDNCVLFDMPVLVRRLEQLYAAMWRRCAAGTLPRSDLTNLDAYLEVGEAIDHEETEVGMIEDYRGWWTTRLSRHHVTHPVPSDRRLCTRMGLARPACSA